MTWIGGSIVDYTRRHIITFLVNHSLLYNIYIIYTHYKGNLHMSNHRICILSLIIQRTDFRIKFIPFVPNSSLYWLCTLSNFSNFNQFFLKNMWTFKILNKCSIDTSLIVAWCSRCWYIFLSINKSKEVTYIKAKVNYYSLEWKEYVPTNLTDDQGIRTN